MISALKTIVESLPKKTLLLGVLVLVLAGLILGSMAISVVSPATPVTEPVISFSPKPGATFFSTQSQAPLTPFQKSLVDRTTDQQVSTMSGILDQQAGIDNTTIYKLQSFIPQRTNEVVTKQGRVIFERILTPINPVGQGFVKISTFLQEHGHPAKQISGSRFYGPFFVTYVYSESGFAFIGNPNTDTIYEIQVFSPMTVEDYLRLYGQDVDPDAKISEQL